WDVASARVLEQAGFPALATSSAGVAWALGYADGERITRGEMLEVVARIAARVRVPLTADMEAGYGPGPEAAAETARGVLAAGAAGLNLEDGANEGRLVDVTLHVPRCHAGPEPGAPPGAPSIPELERLGVRRASLGPRLVQGTLGLLARAARELRERGTYATLADLVVPFAELQRLLGPPP